MNTALKAKIEEAIEKVFEDGAEEGYWDYYIHHDLYKQMANAVELVFDSAQDAQENYERENA